MLTAKALIDEISLGISDTGEDMRARLLAWLNASMRSITSNRAWKSLEKDATVTFSGGVASLPADFGSFVSLEVGQTLYTRAELLTARDAFNDVPGVYIDSTISTNPSTADGDGTLVYQPLVPTYADDETETIFPESFAEVLVRATLTRSYEYDNDDRWSVSAQMFAEQLNALKRADNRLKPLPQYSRNAYIRGN